MVAFSYLHVMSLPQHCLLCYSQYPATHAGLQPTNIATSIAGVIQDEGDQRYDHSNGEKTEDGDV